MDIASTDETNVYSYSKVSGSGTQYCNLKMKQFDGYLIVLLVSSLQGQSCSAIEGIWVHKTCLENATRYIPTSRHNIIVKFIPKRRVLNQIIGPLFLRYIFKGPMIRMWTNWVLIQFYNISQYPHKHNHKIYRYKPDFPTRAIIAFSRSLQISPLMKICNANFILKYLECITDHRIHDALHVNLESHLWLLYTKLYWRIYPRGHAAFPKGKEQPRFCSFFTYFYGS